MYKLLLIVVMIAMVASLFTGLGFLLSDSEKAGSKRLLYALGIRISMAVTLLLLIGFGIYSGQLTLGAPWHQP